MRWKLKKISDLTAGGLIPTRIQRFRVLSQDWLLSTFTVKKNNRIKY